MNHLINSLKVEMQCPDEGMAFNVRHHFAQNMQNEMIEVIGYICTKYSAENEWLRIDQLEIDVGDFDNKAFDKNFKVAFAKQFEKILLDKINKIPLAEKKDTQMKSLADAVRYFLLNGILPWWINRNDFDINDAVQNMLLQQPDAAKSFIIQQQKNEIVWQRIAMQLNAVAKNTIIKNVEVLLAAQQLILNVLQSIIQMVDGNQIIDIQTKRENINELILKFGVVFFSEPLNESLLATVLLNNLNEIINKELPIYNDIIVELNKKIIVKNESIETIKSTKIIENNLVEIISKKQNDDAIEIEKYLVQQAGIVLLSPFYKPFFTNLKLFENGKWISKEAQIKAVHLLYFISTGLMEAPEYNLVLEKIICGLPIAFPIPTKIELIQEEIDECLALITSAIEHWEVLKATSVQGFRQTFLQREGVLKPRESSWLLQIEYKTLDVLLEKIPWGFNTIFLPWLNKIINVEW